MINDIIEKPLEMEDSLIKSIPKAKKPKKEKVEEIIPIRTDPERTVMTVDPVTLDPVGADVLQEKTIRTLAMLNKKRDEPIVFNGGVPCVIIDRTITPIKAATFKSIMGREIHFYGDKNKNLVRLSNTPDGLSSDCFHRIDFGKIFPNIHRVTTLPIIMEDGTILNGWQTINPDGDVINDPEIIMEDGTIVNKPKEIPELGIWQIPDVELQCFKSMTIENAIKILTEPFEGFEFLDDISKGNTWSYFFTMLLHHNINGMVPAYNFTGDKPGLGKSLLPKTLHRIIEGHDPKNISMPGARSQNFDQIFEKKMVSSLIKGALVYRIDNVPDDTKIISHILSTLITEGEIEGNILYCTEDKTLKNNSIFVITGNNISVGPNLRRRVQHIILVSRDEDPELRRFDNDVENDVLKNRNILVTAALKYVRECYKDGLPKSDQVKASFSEWNDISDHLIKSGNGAFGKFSANETSKTDIDPYRIFAEDIYEEYGTELFVPGDLEAIAFGKDGEDGPLLAKLDKSEKANKSRISYHLREMKKGSYIVWDSEQKKDIKIKFDRGTGGNRRKWIIKKAR